MPCLAGTSLSESDGCIDCGADNLWSVNKASNCSVCPPGSFTSGGTATARTACSDCPAGFMCDGSSVVTPCPPGEFSIGGASVCEPCEPGKFSNVTGTVSCNLCDAILGKTSLEGATACDACLADYYIDDDGPVRTL